MNFVYKYDAFSSKLFDKLTAKERAIKNWQRLRIVLLLLQVCGGKTTDEKNTDVEFDQEKKKSCTERFAYSIIDPMNKYKIMWDMFVGTLYGATFIIDPAVFALHFKPLWSPSLSNFTMFQTFVFIFDMILIPFTALPRDDDGTVIDEDEEL